jgi:hypothetical protein
MIEDKATIRSAKNLLKTKEKEKENIKNNGIIDLLFLKSKKINLFI